MAGAARNEKVAQEGAAIWVDMRPEEHDQWVDVSMKDFEQRVVSWKEKEVIESMIKSVEEGGGEKEGGKCSGEGAPACQLTHHVLFQVKSDSTN